MAIKTKTLAEFSDPGNNAFCTWEMDYDDIDLVVRAFRCVNDTRQQVRGRIEKSDDSAKYFELSVTNSRESSVNVFTDVAKRLELKVDKTGRLDGLNLSFAYPGLKAVSRK